MTSFTDRARAEAEKRWHPTIGDGVNQPPFGPDDYIDTGMVDGFVLGAQWAAEQDPQVDFAEYDRGFSDGQAALLASEPTDHEVYEVASLLSTLHKRETETFGQYDRRRARAVLKLARDVRKEQGR